MLRGLIEILSCETTLREQTQLIPKGIKCPPPPRIKKKKKNLAKTSASQRICALSSLNLVKLELE